MTGTKSMVGSVYVSLFGSMLLLNAVSASTEVCYRPKKIGPCEALFPRYFYNTTTCKCDKFYWGGCESNGNMFETLSDCRDTCETPLLVSNSICLQPKQPGMCKAYMPRYWFNATSCSCEQFIYGGCGANDNNFVSEAECQTSCECRDCVCDLPIKPNGDGEITCLALIRSYGFNKTTCQCEEFYGCGGNANRFKTHEECEARCVDNCSPSISICELPADHGPCQSLDSFAPITRYYYNKDTCRCEEFYYGGCEGNSNNFMTIDECVSACFGHGRCENEEDKCYLPRESGKCDALEERFYFDHLTCKCKKFRGCKGNGNNFPSKRKCNKACRDVTCPVCNLPKESGPCKGSFPRYHYNIQTCQCEPFIYGGCGGNENRFETQDKCQSTCGTIQCPVCNLPKARGPCKGLFPRWFFDAADCQCKQFNYGGCGGNLNRFMTKDDCEGSCGSYECPVCMLDQQVGPCRAAINRWYYNISYNKCLKFSWGGCQPNGNNFKTRKECNKVCKGFADLEN